MSGKGLFLKTIVTVVALWLSGTICELGAAEPVVVTNSIKMRLVEIPAGEFLMGSEEDPVEIIRAFPYCDSSWVDAELPRHKVKITRPFLIGQHEVTLNQFLLFYHDAKYKIEAEIDGLPSWGYDKSGEFVESNRFRPWDPVGWKCELTHPVIYVSWNDAVEFCKWLSKKEGQSYRLPTEAEWEYACRAGSQSRYLFGDEPAELIRHANGADASRLKLLYANSTDKSLRSKFLTGDDGFVWTAPVGKFLPNAFGLHDMHGNAWEWCSDWYDENYYAHSLPEDPEGPANGETRVLRGGGFYDAPFHLRCARRNDAPPSSRDFGTGFRVVREIE